jgi:hypothetical protein
VEFGFGLSCAGHERHARNSEAAAIGSAGVMRGFLLNPASPPGDITVVMRANRELRHETHSRQRG